MDDKHNQARFWNEYDVTERLSTTVRYVIDSVTGLYRRVIGHGFRTNKAVEKRDS